MSSYRHYGLNYRRKYWIIGKICPIIGIVDWVIGKA